tara:strand:- start:7034 stop:7732 length:699 start_codon:yes stop_codon:yes gene_type:complete
MNSGKFKAPWLSISDMMTGLMMIFLFISVSYSHQVSQESEEVIEKQDDIEEIVRELIDHRLLISQALHNEFDEDLEEWNATIVDETLTFRFESPEVLFRAGEANVSPLFENIISDFWPRYLQILNSHNMVISEIKIEGHTSSEWSGTSSRDDSYFNNMKLSQDRSRNVLYSCYQNTPENLREWVISNITATGFSFSRLKYSEGKEDPDASRRVEFTIVIDTEQSITEITETF